MNIDKINHTLPASQIGELAPKSPNAKATGGSAPSETSVHLGTASAQLRELENSVAGTQVVNKEKVAAIKQAISEGRFQVNSAAVADGLINSVKEMINSSSSGSSNT